MSARLRLGCRLLGHKPEPFPRWNDGYYFARCRRCGDQLVRTAYGRWRPLPNGLRIVWSTVRPESLAAMPMLIDPADAEPEACLPQAPTQKRPVSHVPDFMEDAKTDTSWRHHLPPVPADAEQNPGVRSAKSARADFARLIPPLRGSAAPDGDQSRRPARRAAVAIVVLSLALIVVMLFVRNDDAGATARAAPPTYPTMFVTAGMTSCRQMASPEAAHVRHLVRGDAVQLVGREADWGAISYGGQQCWVPLGLLSDDPVT